jgi:DNA-binding transcriptional LysR family regulator
MTLTELRYIVAVARERHFAAPPKPCFVSQPTLSVIKKLEQEPRSLFERGGAEVSVTPLGEEIVRQAQSVLEMAAAIKETAKRGKDPLAGPLRLGLIYTIGPYLLPALVRQMIKRVPQMPLVLQENFTARLLEMLRSGELDCAILAEPFPDAGLALAPLYDEPFMIAVPHNHALAARRRAQARNDAAARHRALLSRPCARSLPRIRSLLEQRRRHPQEFRGLVARNDHAHGRLRHGHHRRAAVVDPAREAIAGCLHSVRAAGADAPRRPRLAAQFPALRGDRGASQCSPRLQARGGQLRLTLRGAAQDGGRTTICSHLLQALCSGVNNP